MNRRLTGGIALRLREWARSATRKFCMLIVGLACVAALALVLLDLAGLMFGSGDFGVREIAVFGEQMAREEDVLYLAGIEPGTTIWLVRKNEVAERVVSHPWIRACTVQKVPPSRIEITVQERAPVISCMDPQTGDTYGIDAGGFVLPSFQILFADRDPVRRELARATLIQLPIVTGHGIKQFTPGQQILAPRLRRAINSYVRLKRTAPNLAATIDAMDLSTVGELVFIPKDGFGPIRTSEFRLDDIDRKLAVVWNLLQDNKFRPEYIDARFPEIGLALKLDPVSERSWLELCRTNRSAPG